MQKKIGSKRGVEHDMFILLHPFPSIIETPWAAHGPHVCSVHESHEPALGLQSEVGSVVGD